MYSGKTIDSRSGLPKDIDYELLRFQTHPAVHFFLAIGGLKRNMDIGMALRHQWAILKKTFGAHS